MMSADSLKCQLTDAAEIICDMPPTNGWEIAAAIGTVSAAVVAGGLGYLTWRSEQKARTNADIERNKAERQRAKDTYHRNLENQFTQVAASMRQMVTSFPNGERENQAWFQSQYQAYLRYLGKEDGNADLTAAAQQVLQLFALIDFQYSAATNPKAATHVIGFWEKVEYVRDFKAIMTELSAKFESALQHWHRTGDDRGNAEAILIFLFETYNDKFEEIEKTVNA